MSDDQKRSFGWKRWTIATLLFLMFCFAGFFTGFRFGLSDGLDEQVKARMAERDALVYPKTYRVTDLLGGRTDKRKAIFEVCDCISRDVSPESWEANGGASTMSPYFQNSSVVVSTTARVHDLVTAYLAWKRRETKQCPDTTTSGKDLAP